MHVQQFCESRWGNLPSLWVIRRTPEIGSKNVFPCGRGPNFQTGSTVTKTRSMSASTFESSTYNFQRFRDGSSASNVPRSRIATRLLSLFLCFPKRSRRICLTHCAERREVVGVKHEGFALRVENTANRLLGSALKNLYRRRRQHGDCGLLPVQASRAESQSN